jgi:hypothetical protein
MTQPSPADAAALANQLALLNTGVSQLVQFFTHVSTGAMTAHVIEWAKGTTVLGGLWRSLSPRLKVWAGMLAAALPAAGITFTFSHPADGAYVLAVSNLTVATFFVFAWSLLQNWVMQQGWYQAVIKPRAVTGSQPSAGATHVDPVVVTTKQPPAAPAEG